MSYDSERAAEERLKTRSRELLGIFQSAVRDAHPLAIKQVREEAKWMGYTDKEISRAFLLLTERGDAVLDSKMRLVPPSKENPFRVYC